MKLLIRNIGTSFLIAIILTSFILPATVLAQQEWSGVCVAEGLQASPDGSLEAGRGDDVATIQGFQCLIANAFSVIITVIGLAGFVMFVIGAFQWMLSGSNTKGVDTARQSMTYAIIGIVVSLSGFIIINLIASFTGVNVIRQFVIPGDDTPARFVPAGGGGSGG